MTSSDNVPFPRMLAWILGMSPLAHYVVETLVTLLAIVALSVLVLLGARRAGMGRSAGPLELVGRLPLDGRRAVYLVRVGTTVYVVGASEAASFAEVKSGAAIAPAANVTISRTIFENLIENGGFGLPPSH